MSVILFLVVFLPLLNNSLAVTKLGFTHLPNPDVFKCGDHFYYIGYSSSVVSRYFAMTGSSAQK